MSRSPGRGTTTRRTIAPGVPAGVVAGLVIGVLATVSTVLTACGSPATTTAELVPTAERAPTTAALADAAATTSDATTSTLNATTIPPSTAETTTTTDHPRQRTLPIAPPQDARAPEDNPPIGRISIPTIGLDAVLHDGIRLTTLDRGPGHWPGSAMPGELGNLVVGGHRTSHGAEFRHLDRLVPGDEMVLTTDTGSHTYTVTGTEVVGPDALWITDPTDTATATLFACHPLGSTAERIVVFLALAT